MRSNRERISAINKVLAVFTAAGWLAGSPAASAKQLDYHQCVGKLPASVREPNCTAVIEVTKNDRVMQEKAYNARGHARVELARYSDAVADFTKVIRLDPRIAGYYDNRQNAYRQMGALDDALRDASTAVRLAPTYSFVYRSRGIVLSAMARWPLAIDDFTHAISLDPNDSGIHVERGQALDGDGRTEDAVDDFTQAIALDAEQIEAYKVRGFAERKLGRSAAAIDDLAKYQLVHPTDVDVTAALSALRGGGR